MYSVSSSFVYLAAQKNATWQRLLTIGGSDYSDKVLAWPVIERAWDDCSPGSVTIDLSNADRTFNFFLTAGEKLHSAVLIKLGLNGEYITVMGGTTDALQFHDEICTATIIDKFKKLADRIVGSTTVPVAYISSSYLVNDLAWYLCTSHGGLSAIASTSNPDIDYASFQAWTAVFSYDNVRIRGNFTGQSAAELLKKIATITQSAVHIENDKIKFGRFSLVGSSAISITDDNTIAGTQTMDERDLINKFYVGADYDVSSKFYRVTVNDMSSASIVIYGLKEDTLNEECVWYVDSASALNFAQRMVETCKIIQPKMRADMPLMATHITIGDTIYMSDSHLQIADTYRVMAETLDMDRGSRSLLFDQTQYQSAFRLDFSTLDGVDILT
jgi:hypothetical protein